MALFPQFYKKSSLNVAFLCYCYFGGILYSTEISGKCKKLWLTLVLTVSSIIIVSILGYILTSNNTPIQDLLRIFVPLNLTCGYLFSILFVSLKHADIESSIADFNDFIQRHSHLLAHKNKTKITRIEKYLADFCLLLAFFMMWIIPILRVLLADEEIDLNDKTLYLYPFPDSFQVTSVPLFLCISFIQLMTFLLNMISVVLAFKIHVIFTSEITLWMDSLRYYLRDQSKLTSEAIETNHNLELTTKSPNSIREAFVAQRENMYREFDQNIVYFIRLHQKFNKTVAKLLPTIESGSTVWILFLPPILVSMGNDILTAIKTEFSLEDVERFAVGMVSLLLLYNVFSLPRKVEISCEKLRDEVYATPWYLLPKRYRQNIHTLMIQVQKPILFTFFQTYKLQMSLLPEILNKCYSYIMFIQTTIDKTKSE